MLSELKRTGQVYKRNNQEGGVFEALFPKSEHFEEVAFNNRVPGIITLSLNDLQIKKNPTEVKEVSVRLSCFDLITID